ncbi:MAG: exonuclease SbcCD subunit D, partial [Planctomycetota bacterium]
GEVDYPDRWPTAVELPKNVQTVSAAAVDELVVERRGKPLATIIASGFDHRRRGIGEFIVEAAAPFPIVMTHGQLDSVVLAAKHVRYWALGGQHKPALVDRSTSWVAYPGTPQARRPEETGAHGCHLVRVDGTGTVRTQFIELDSVRWMPQKLALAESSTPDQIRELLTDRALKLISEHPEQTLLVTWQLSPAGEFNPQLRQHRLQQETLKWLRDEFGRSEQGIWSISLQTDPPAALPASWYEEDTILGDYLRALGRYQGDESIGLALHDYLPRSVQPDAVAEVLRLQGEERTRVLSAAGLMGVEYLTANRDVA